VDGHYQIGIYTVRPIAEGEEITFDYNSVTESKEEHEASVCLCGSQICRGSYLNFSGEGAFEKVNFILVYSNLGTDTCSLSNCHTLNFILHHFLSSTNIIWNRS
jgi:esterase/lipase superfamily enzyme